MVAHTRASNGVKAAAKIGALTRVPRRAGNREVGVSQETQQRAPVLAMVAVKLETSFHFDRVRNCSGRAPTADVA
jgi:hypothetical protein